MATSHVQLVQTTTRIVSFETGGSFTTTKSPLARKKTVYWIDWLDLNHCYKQPIQDKSLVQLRQLLQLCNLLELMKLLRSQSHSL